MSERLDSNAIAIIGMSGRFPGAADVETFWKNLRDGVESIRFLTDDELRDSGVDRRTLTDPNYVRATAFPDAPEAFDAAFFGMNHREAEITDPQHRVLLECAWTALEDAGYNSNNYEGIIGVFAGATINTYALLNLANRPELLSSLDPVQINIGNSGDFLVTRIAYKLNLKGPSYTIQSACSTSLVAVHTACESLLNEQCDIALAGGVSINVSLRNGYHYIPGGMTSPDGRCRPFDANAQGTIFGSGVGVVALKRLEDALADGDHVYAIILGSAINNDGSLKVGYTAPSVEGQAKVITEALANAGVNASTISYVEAHGTATPLGDPIEIQALTKAFRAYTRANGFCAIGSVKGNIGHLDAAAGIAGLIKVALALKHRQLPPSLHFRSPNPNIDFDNSPFYVNTSLKDCEAKAGPARASVSAFGVGGTNAHVVLQEAPSSEGASPARSWQLLMLSAKTEASLKRMRANLAAHLEANSDLTLADAAYTLQAGRQSFPHRSFVLAENVSGAIAALKNTERLFTSVANGDGKTRPVIFMFTGQGSQYINMGRRLYNQELAFRQEVDHCAGIIKNKVGFDLLAAIYPAPGSEAEASRLLQETAVAQPSLFVIEYALAQLYMSWGIQPQSLVGHSIGEYCAACLAGVFSLEDALTLVVARGRLMQDLPGGAMLAVPLSEFELQPYLNHELAIAAINGPGRCTVAGTESVVAELETRLQDAGVSPRRLHTSHAFHSPMMEPMLRPFADVLAKINLRPPQAPYLSNVTGRWISASEATDPNYWVRHIRATVRFADNLAEAMANADAVLLELGPGQTLTRLAHQHPACKTKHLIATLRPPEQDQNDVAVALTALGRLWLAGVEPDWKKFYQRERRRRAPLPAYSFARERYWIDAAPRNAESQTSLPDLERRDKVDHWFYAPAWRRAAPDMVDYINLAVEQRRWLLFADDLGMATALSQQLKAAGQSVSIVHRGSAFTDDSCVFTINPAQREDYNALVRTLVQAGRLPDIIIHLWSITDPNQLLSFEQAQQRGFYCLLFLLQAMAQLPEERSVDLQIVSNQLFALTANEPLQPEKATLLGVVKALPYEFPHVRCQVLDVAVSEKGDKRQAIDRILGAAANFTQKTLAYRGTQCWQQVYQPLPIPPAGSLTLRSNGIYLLTGGLLEIGTEITEYLAGALHARLVLIEEAPFPEAEEWDLWLATHDPTNSASRRIRHARHLVDLGAQVLALAIDYSDPGQMRDAVRQAIETFGPLNGVFHNARVLGERSFRTMLETGVGESEWQFIPKIHGAMNLAQAIAGQPIDFCLFNSSLSSILGGIGMVSYAAANSFLDAFAQQQDRANAGLWVSVNWEAWLNTQMSAVSPVWADVALNRDEGIEVLKRVLGAGGCEQVIVSTVDLAARIERMRQRVGLEVKRAAESSETPRRPVRICR